ncbi:MAG: DUF4954 family protein [Rikenellaceae bacterium]
MSQLRALKAAEQAALEARCCFADDWTKVRVSECFSVAQLSMSRFGGSVEIHAGARVHNSTVVNYSLGEGSLVDRVSLLECSGSSSFGNGVKVASLNECGGRAIKIYDTMSAQVAYIATLYRHRPLVVERIEAMVDALCEQRRSSMGSVGACSKVIAAGIIRDVRIASNVTIEGASSLSNGTLLEGSYFGADVKAHDFIAVEASRVDGGASIERCFVGERVILSSGFTALDSLFFSMSHCENGEAVSVFAAPFTVSHHKSSLLIAGMFSFFNAGSGSNQSNHLFKCGPVHQGVHMRGCKFGSSAYVMLPAVDGAYTTVIGSHNSHHDTSAFPFSYLINKDGRSTLIPASNISSYGYMRDVEKWKRRDVREVKRDIINFEEHNPYITGMVIEALNISNSLMEKSSEAQSYVHNNVVISANNLRRGLTLYNKFVAGSLGAMLSYGGTKHLCEGRSKWVDLAGQYITSSAVEELLSDIESGEISTLAAIDEQLQAFANEYESYAADWAMGTLQQMLGRVPSPDMIEEMIAGAAKAREELKSMALRDMKRDLSESMAVSYGIDSDDKQDKIADYNAVRGVN